MAQETDPMLQKQVIYSVFVRNHTKEGTFLSVIPDLDRIRALGVDVVWLMPIHPIGEKSRKGADGSPYAIRDYRAVNPEYGTPDDFRALVDAIHERGMRCIIDVVYNHTSPDSVLWGEHPEWFYHRPDGTPGNHVGDWSDIIDLDYGSRGLWDYQIETLRQWARVVDGFRCDVASFVPVEFWKAARAAVEEVRPGAIWLAETVHRGFGKACRAIGLYSARDTDAYEAFDIEYAYDLQETFDRYLQGRATLSHYLDLVDFQDCVYPEGYNKLRYLENHDLPRIASRDDSPRDLRNLTAMTYFLKGTTLLYAGQEVSAAHRPSLFDRDPVDWSRLGDPERDLGALMRRLSRIKHDLLEPTDLFTASADDERNVAVAYRDDVRDQGDDACRTVGIFSLRGVAGEVGVDVADGTYENLVDGSEVEVRDGRALCTGEPVIMRARRPGRLAV